MKRKTAVFMLMFAIFMASCGLISSKDNGDLTTDMTPSQLWQITSQIFKSGPDDPWRERDEFKTDNQYEEDLTNRYQEYLEAANQYYYRKETETFTLLQEIEVLEDYNANKGFYEISVILYTVEESSYNAEVIVGPNFQLFLPPESIETIHLFDESERIESENYQVRNGALSEIVFYAYMPVKAKAGFGSTSAEDVREVFDDEDNGLFIQLDMQFEFPDAFQGYRFLPKNIRERDSNLTEEDIEYGRDEGKISVKVVSVKLVDNMNNELHSWPSGLYVAQTPTITPTATITPTPSPTATIIPTLTATLASEIFTCPGAPESRVAVNQMARVTAGPPNLRVRKTPSGEILGSLRPGTSFKIIGGPECKDRYIWWQVDIDNYDLEGVWLAEGKPGNYFIEPLD